MAMHQPTRPGWRQLFSREVVLPTTVLVVVLVGWELAVPAAGVEQYILPTPSAIAAAFVDNHGTIFAELQVTLREFAIGFGLSLVSGYLLALVMFEWKFMEVTFFPYVIVIRSIPIVTLLPIFIIWFGFGTNTVVVVSYLISFFPMVVNTLSGFQETDERLVEMLESFSANRREVYKNVYLYSSLPTVFAGIKISVILAFTGAIVGEFLVGNQGIGALILEYNMTFATPAMFAAVFTVSISELACFGSVVALQRYVVDWT
jgi:NitT/TauT family transport system permease protein